MKTAAVTISQITGAGNLSLLCGNGTVIPQLTKRGFTNITDGVTPMKARIQSTIRGNIGICSPCRTGAFIAVHPHNFVKSEKSAPLSSNAFIKPSLRSVGMHTNAAQSVVAFIVRHECGVYAPFGPDLFSEFTHSMITQLIWLYERASSW